MVNISFYGSKKTTYERVINIDYISESKIRFVITYNDISTSNTTWTSNSIIAKIDKSDGIAYFNTNVVSGSIYIDENSETPALLLNISKSNSTAVSCETTTYFKIHEEANNTSDRLASSKKYEDSTNETHSKRCGYRYSVVKNAIIISQSENPPVCNFKIQCEYCGTLSTNTYYCLGPNNLDEYFEYHHCKNCGKSTLARINCEYFSYDD